MSQRKLKPPASITSYAKHVRCSDCNSITERPQIDEHGVWHSIVRHDDWCPVLTGHVSKADMHINATKQSEHDGHRAMVVHVEYR